MVEKLPVQRLPLGEYFNIQKGIVCHSTKQTQKSWFNSIHTLITFRWSNGDTRTHGYTYGQTDILYRHALVDIGPLKRANTSKKTKQIEL